MDFQAPNSLHKPPGTVSHYLPLSSEFCGQISENIFYFLDLLAQKLLFDKNH